MLSAHCEAEVSHSGERQDVWETEEGLCSNSLVKTTDTGIEIKIQTRFRQTLDREGSIK